MLLTILSYHQIAPAYIDFLAVFGFQIRQRDLHFTRFYEDMSFEMPNPGLVSSDLKRSGKFFQMCYNLKSVGIDEVKKDDFGGDNFKARSFRQVVIHHSFDISNGRALWVLTHGNWDVMRAANKLINSGGRPQDKDYTSVKASIKSSLAMHLLLSRWAAETWRGYLHELENAVDQAVSKESAAFLAFI
jgi:hypothetical protein